ncbi:MAG: hypothetical protein JJ931_05360 [Henriciella sp.]|nr:hypothetical protein [Henriciella sp.]MBO6694828.1 hypothetical protein [Henriciella sp.]
MKDISDEDAVFDERFYELMNLIEHRVAVFQIVDENSIPRQLTPKAKRKLLLAVTANMLDTCEPDQAVSELVNEIARLVPEMEANGWLRFEHRAEQEKRRLKTEALVENLPERFNGTQNIGVPEEVPTEDKLLRVSWLIAQGEEFKSGERICCLTDSADQHFYLVLEYDGIVGEQSFLDGDLAMRGDTLGLMIIAYPTD